MDDVLDPFFFYMPEVCLHNKFGAVGDFENSFPTFSDFVFYFVKRTDVFVAEEVKSVFDFIFLEQFFKSFFIIFVNRDVEIV